MSEIPQVWRTQRGLEGFCGECLCVRLQEAHSPGQPAWRRTSDLLPILTAISSALNSGSSKSGKDLKRLLGQPPTTEEGHVPNHSGLSSF